MLKLCETRPTKEKQGALNQIPRNDMGQLWPSLIQIDLDAAILKQELGVESGTSQWNV